MTRLGLIADDLTGALDSAAPFALRGYQTTLSLGDSEVLEETEIEVRSTESRNLPSEQAAARIRQIILTTRIREAELIYKKIDSTLRGPIAAELTALVDALEIERAVICPAFPQQGRTTFAGRLFVDGAPLSETAFGGEVGTDSLIELLARGGPRSRLSYLPLDVLRQAPDLAVRVLAEPKLVIADAETTNDLQMLTRMSLDAGIRLLVGSAGLAYSLAGVLPLKTASGTGIVVGPTNVASGNVLVIAGSRHPRTLEQLAALRDSNLPATILAAPPLDSLKPRRPEAVAAELAETAGRAIEQRDPRGLIVTGGDIAWAVCRRFGVNYLHLIGQVEPGMPVSRIAGGDAGGIRLVTKAGGFGDTLALARAVSYLAS